MKANIDAEVKDRCGLDSLERKGLVKKSDIFGIAPNGEVQPAWALTPLTTWLFETGQMDNYLATWKTDLKLYTAQMQTMGMQALAGHSTCRLSKEFPYPDGLPTMTAKTGLQ
jgi:hypothetical protein